MRTRDSGTGKLDVGIRKPSSEPPNRDDSIVITSSHLRWLYRTYNYEPIAWDRNVLGVVGFLFQYPSQTDLTMFMCNFRSDGADATFRVVDVNKAIYNPIDVHHESNLNIQYTEAITYPTPNIFYSTGLGQKEWLVPLLDTVAFPLSH
jgi:hypothetical protein